MRQAQNSKRVRGRGGRKMVNQLNRTMDSNGPDVKIRGTASHIFEKYQTLARDANSSGDRISAENYLQHAEHYFRLINAMQAQANGAGAQPGARNGARTEAQGDGPQPAVEDSPQPAVAPESGDASEGDDKGADASAESAPPARGRGAPRGPRGRRRAPNSEGKSSSSRKAAASSSDSEPQLALADDAGREESHA